jgi:hypothetical protein
MTLLSAEGTTCTLQCYVGTTRVKRVLINSSFLVVKFQTFELQEIVGLYIFILVFIVPYNRPPSLPSISFPVNYLLITLSFHTTQSELLTASLNKSQTKTDRSANPVHPECKFRALPLFIFLCSAVDQ